MCKSLLQFFFPILLLSQIILIGIQPYSASASWPEDAVIIDLNAAASMTPNAALRQEIRTILEVMEEARSERSLGYLSEVTQSTLQARDMLDALIQKMQAVTETYPEDDDFNANPPDPKDVATLQKLESAHSRIKSLVYQAESPTSLSPYDLDGNGISRQEALAAVKDYLLNSKISKRDAQKAVELYKTQLKTNTDLSVGLPQIRIDGAKLTGSIYSIQFANAFGPQSKWIIIRNTGTANLIINDISFVAGEYFTLSEPLDRLKRLRSMEGPFTVTSGGLKVIVIEHDPRQNPKLYTDMLIISSNAADFPIESISLTASPWLPVLDISERAADFGSVDVGKAGKKQVSVSYTPKIYSGELPPVGVQVRLADNDGFEFTSNNKKTDNVTFELEPNQKKMVQLSFTPDVGSRYLNEVVVMIYPKDGSTGVATPVASILLTGEGKKIPSQIQTGIIKKSLAGHEFAYLKITLNPPVAATLNVKETRQDSDGAPPNDDQFTISTGIDGTYERLLGAYAGENAFFAAATYPNVGSFSTETTLDVSWDGNERYSPSNTVFKYSEIYDDRFDQTICCVEYPYGGSGPIPNGSWIPSSKYLIFPKPSDVAQYSIDGQEALYAIHLSISFPYRSDPEELYNTIINEVKVRVGTNIDRGLLQYSEYTGISPVKSPSGDGFRDVTWIKYLKFEPEVKGRQASDDGYTICRDNDYDEKLEPTYDNSQEETDDGIFDCVFWPDIQPKITTLDGQPDSRTMGSIVWTGNFKPETYTDKIPVKKDFKVSLVTNPCCSTQDLYSYEYKFEKHYQTMEGFLYVAVDLSPSSDIWKEIELGLFDIAVVEEQPDGSLSYPRIGKSGRIGNIMSVIEIVGTFEGRPFYFKNSGFDELKISKPFPMLSLEPNYIYGSGIDAGVALTESEKYFKQTLRLKNIGRAPLNVNALSVFGDGLKINKTEPQLPIVIEPDKYADVMVDFSFTPGKTVGKYDGYIQIIGSGIAGGTSPYATSTLRWVGFATEPVSFAFAHSKTTQGALDIVPIAYWNHYAYWGEGYGQVEGKINLKVGTNLDENQAKNILKIIEAGLKGSYGKSALIEYNKAQQAFLFSADVTLAPGRNILPAIYIPNFEFQGFVDKREVSGEFIAHFKDVKFKPFTYSSSYEIINYYYCPGGMWDIEGDAAGVTFFDQVLKWDFKYTCKDNPIASFKHSYITVGVTTGTSILDDFQVRGVIGPIATNGEFNNQIFGMITRIGGGVSLGLPIAEAQGGLLAFKLANSGGAGLAFIYTGTLLGYDVASALSSGSGEVDPDKLEKAAEISQTITNSILADLMTKEVASHDKRIESLLDRMQPIDKTLWKKEIRIAGKPAVLVYEQIPGEPTVRVNALNDNIARYELVQSQSRIIHVENEGSPGGRITANLKIYVTLEGGLIWGLPWGG